MGNGQAGIFFVAIFAIEGPSNASTLDETCSLNPTPSNLGGDLPHEPRRQPSA